YLTYVNQRHHIQCSRIPCRDDFSLLSSFFFNAAAPTEIYTLSLHDALPIWTFSTRTSPAPYMSVAFMPNTEADARRDVPDPFVRSEEHTSELQSRFDLVCRLLLEKKKNRNHLHDIFVILDHDYGTNS